MNRAERRRAGRDSRPIAGGFSKAQLREAEAELEEGAVRHESSYASTMSVLAHAWFAVDHQRESARMTYQRTIELRKSGRELSTDGIVQQFAEAKSELLVLEDQIVRLLKIVEEAPEGGGESALALLAATHMNMGTGIGVRLPDGIRERLATDAGLLEAEDQAASDLQTSPSGPPLDE